MKDFDIEERTQKALNYFVTGYNCSQSVFMAYADIFDVNEELAKNLSSGFGGGIGRMREICGTVSAMTLLAGLKYPVNDITNNEERTKNYATVQKMANEFKSQYNSIICRDLLSSLKDISNNPNPDKRTEEYYKVRPCSRFVETAARIAGKIIKE